MKTLLKIAVLCAFASIAWGQACGTIAYNPLTGTIDCLGANGQGAANVSAKSSGAVTSLTLNTSALNVADTTTMLVQCWTGTTTFAPVAISSLNPVTIAGGIVTVVTPNFASTGNVYCAATSNSGAGPTGAAGAAGATGAAGRSPVWIVKAGTPSDVGDGSNGDMYLNSTTQDVYGPKTGGAWGAIASNIKGATGSTGATGATGSTGPAGPAGPQVTAVNAQTGTTYTFLNSDCTKLVTFSNSSAVAVTLPQAGGGGSFAATCGIWVNNLGTGQVTITPTTSTINGVATLVLNTKQSALIISDGTNYSAQVGAGNPTVGTSILKGDGAGGTTNATPGTDFAPATTGSAPLKGNGAGGTAAAAQTDIAALWTGTNCSGTNTLQLDGNCHLPGGQAGADIPVTQSAATATFTCSSNTVNTFRITLTQNVTSSTVASCGAGQILNFIVNVGTGPFTFAYPSGFTLATDLSVAANNAANATYTQPFEWTGSAARPLAQASVDLGGGRQIESAMPSGTPGAGNEFCVYDSTEHTYQCKDSSANLNSMVRTAGSGTANQFVDYIAATGIPHTSQASAGGLSDFNNVVMTNAARTLAALLTAPGGDLFNGGVNAQVGTTYTIGQADENKLTTFNNGSAVAVTLPQTTTAGFGSGAYFTFFNRGAGTVTITPTVSTINGSATLTLSQNQGCFMVSDGTNYSAWVSASPAGGNATTVNGGSLPNSAPFVGTNSSGQIILATPFATNAQTATYQVLAGDFTSYKTIIVASGTFTITLVANTSQPPTGQLVNVINYGSGVVTIARSGQNINGGTTSLTLPAGSATAPSAATVVSDGTNYFANVTISPALANITGLGTGVGTFLGTPSSANLAGALTDETGSGAAVFGTSPTLTTPNLGTPSALNLTNATGLPAAQVPAVLTTVGTSRTIANNAEIVICTGTCTVTPPATGSTVAGMQFCAQNDDNVATVITIAAVTSVLYENTARTSYKSAATALASSGAVKDQICMVARDATHWNVFSATGTWN